jgi:hypothetical protein
MAPDAIETRLSCPRRYREHCIQIVVRTRTHIAIDVPSVISPKTHIFPRLKSKVRGKRETTLPETGKYSIFSYWSDGFCHAWGRCFADIPERVLPDEDSPKLHSFFTALFAAPCCIQPRKTSKAWVSRVGHGLERKLLLSVAFVRRSSYTSLNLPNPLDQN